MPAILGRLGAFLSTISILSSGVARGGEAGYETEERKQYAMP